MTLSPIVFLFALFASPEAPPAAPPPAPLAPAADPWCEEQNNYVEPGESVHCEVRTLTMASGGTLRVEAAPNGGISARGEDRRDVEVQARVWTRSQTASGAQALADRVRIYTDETLRYELEPGAETRQGSGRPDFAQVSFRLHVPLASDLHLTTHNGGLHVTNVTGRIRFRSQNGGVHLQGVGGNVEGHTQNGRLDIDLTGDRWEGDHLDVSTMNGGVDISVPRVYSAELETGTKNGGFDVALPEVGAETRRQLANHRNGRSLTVTLGDGGPSVRATTTNGGVSVSMK